MLRLQIHMSSIQIELHLPLQLEHTHVQNIHKLCNLNDYNNQF
jgi:hypothetical protein